MNKRPYLIIGWILALVSVVAVIAVPLLPERHWNFMAETRFNPFLVTDQNKGGGTAAVWLDQNLHHFVCTIKPQANDSFCALQFSLVDQPGSGRDLSRFNRLRIKVRLQGPGKMLRMYLRVFDERISKLAQPETAKFQSYVFTPNSQRSIELPLAGFSVADWWVRDYAHRRDLAQLDFTNVLLLGVDIPAPMQPGDYDIALEELEFVGPWVVLEEVLVGLIILWCLLASTFLLVGWLKVRAQWRLDFPAWRELEQRLGGYKPTAVFRPFSSFRDTSTQCLDHTGLVLALVELLHQNVRARLPFAIVELVASPNPGSFTQSVIAEEGQVEFAERLKRYTNDETGVVVRWSGPCFIVLGTSSREQLMARITLLRAALRLNPLFLDGQTLPTDLIVSDGVLADLDQAYNQLFASWWRLQWRKRTGLVGIKPKNN